MLRDSDSDLFNFTGVFGSAGDEEIRLTITVYLIMKSREPSQSGVSTLP